MVFNLAYNYIFFKKVSPLIISSSIKIFITLWYLILCIIYLPYNHIFFKKLNPLIIAHLHSFDLLLLFYVNSALQCRAIIQADCF